jgi:hypothetical protein
VNTREQLIAYVATLVALVTIIIGALLIGAWNAGVLGKVEMFGIGTVTGGLIGVLRLPSTRSSLGATQTGDVNVETKS